MPHGSGTLYYPAGTKYIGGWTNGDRTGYGTLIGNTGDVLKGQWENDEFRKGTYVYKNGKAVPAERINGKLVVGQIQEEGPVAKSNPPNDTFIPEPAKQPPRSTNTNGASGSNLSQICKENPWGCVAGAFVAAAAIGVALDKSFPSTPSNTCHGLYQDCVRECKVNFYRASFFSCEHECDSKLTCYP